MYEIIKEQYEQGKSRSQSRYLIDMKRIYEPEVNWDFFPINEEHYHPLNPCFLFNLQGPNIMKFNKVITVRDGYLTFCDFILNNYQNIPSWDNLYLINPALTPIIPPQLRQYFATWTTVQKKKLEIEAAKKVIIFGFASSQYLGEVRNINLRLRDLKKISPEAEINLLIAGSEDPFEEANKDASTGYALINEIKDLIPDRRINLLKTNAFDDFSNCSETYFLDLAYDSMLISDNYLHHFFASKAGTISSFHSEIPSKCIFEMDLSFYHKLYIQDLPEIESLFGELLYYKKQLGLKSIVKNNAIKGMLRSKLGR